MLTIGQGDEFERLGIVRLPGAIARADAEEMCNRVWRALGKRYGLRRESPATWKGQYLLGTHHLPKSETFPEIGSPAIRSALDDLFGSGNWEPPERWGSLLVTFPNSHDRWTVPHQAWHLDYPASSEMKELSIVRIFVCLAKLGPCSGGTVFVAGSHRAVQNLVSKDGVARMRSADARTALIRTHAGRSRQMVSQSEEAAVQNVCHTRCLQGLARHIPTVFPYLSLFSLKLYTTRGAGIPLVSLRLG